MSDYSKLVKALRYCAESGDFNCNKDCPMYQNYPRCLTKMDMDAAAAIEALQAEIESSEQNCQQQLIAMARHNAELQAEVKRLQDKLCDWCAVCPKERRRPEDCEMLGENPVMYGPSGAKMEVQDGKRCD